MTVRIDNLLDTTSPLDEHVGAVDRQGDLAFTDRAQVMLEVMRKLLGRPQLDHGRNGFQRMEISEEVVDERPLGSWLAECGIQLQKRVRGRREMVFGLREIIVQKSVKKRLVACHVTGTPQRLPS